MFFVIISNRRVEFGFDTSFTSYDHFTSASLSKLSVRIRFDQDNSNKRNNIFFMFLMDILDKFYLNTIYSYDHNSDKDTPCFLQFVLRRFCQAGSFITILGPNISALIQ